MEVLERGRDVQRVLEGLALRQRRKVFALVDLVIERAAGAPLRDEEEALLRLSIELREGGQRSGGGG